MLRALQFDGAPVLVTGGSMGIGKATADALASLGAHTILVARTAETLAAAQADIRSRGASCDIFSADVTSEEDVAGLADWVQEKFGSLKALVNNAGTNFRTPLAYLPTAKWREIVSANLDSVFYMCRSFIPLLLKAEGPSIVNVASSFGTIGMPQMPVYCATKGAVVNLTRQLAIDYGPKGLRVNALCPGPTLSPRFKSYIEKGLTDPSGMIAKVPLGRLAECDEIGNVAAFLASDAASFMNGATIAADGGQTIV
jgi:NAD(P)-dependent dehydrogenase (short-subunit alcohol dehydrogenase family)